MRTNRVILLALGGLAATVAGLRRMVLVTNVHGMSMSPSYRDGDRLLAVRHPGVRRLRAGDVVICRLPAGYAVPGAGVKALIVKRIAGLPGEPVPSGAGAAIPPGTIYVLGDAPDHSLDSRTFGPLPQALVVGVVIARLPMTQSR